MISSLHLCFLESRDSPCLSSLLLFFNFFSALVNLSNFLQETICTLSLFRCVTVANLPEVLIPSTSPGSSLMVFSVRSALE